MKSIHQLCDMTGRVTLITGATGFIGKAITETVAELGSHVLLLDLETDALRTFANEIEKKFKVSAKYIELDLEDESRISGLSEIISDYYPVIDVLINNAAFVGTSDITGWVTSFEEQSVSTWKRALNVNLTSAFALSKECINLLKTSEHGSIINIASIYGVYGPDLSLYEGTSMGNPAAYAASKGGLLQLTRWLATTVAPEVRVNAISPGGVFRNQPEKFCERYIQRTPLKRMATEEDFKGAIAYLASDMSCYVTGQNIIVDGGWGVW